MGCWKIHWGLPKKNSSGMPLLVSALFSQPAALDESRNCKEPLSWTYPTCNDVITIYPYNTYMYIPLDTHMYIYIYCSMYIYTYTVHIPIIPCIYIYRCLLILLLLPILFLFIAGRSIAGFFNGDHLNKKNYGGGHLGGVGHRHGTTKVCGLVPL